MDGLPEIDPVEVDLVRIARFTSEDEFNVLAVNLFGEVASYTCVAARTMGPTPTWSRDQAVIGGNMVRLFKLQSALLDQTCQKRRETSAILARLAFETVVSVRYLIANFSPALVDSYIRYSLRHGRKLRDRIQSNIAARSGVVQPIETRMLCSIERSASVSRITLDSIDLKDKAPWGRKHLQQKAEDVGLGAAYDAMFGGMSHNVHGAWEDIYSYHVEVVGDDQFTPKLEWDRPRPQILLALGTVVLDAVCDFLRLIGGNEILAEIGSNIENLAERIRIVDSAHEAYLAQRQWPQV